MIHASLLRDTDHYHELVNARLRLQGDNAHYLETVRENNGVTWINHSIATTVDMTWFALRDIPGPAVLIIGGVDRSDEQHKLKELVKQKVKVLICLGSTPWKYFETFRDDARMIVRARDLNEAVEMAKVFSKEEVRTVLFSPSCPSYDAFDNYRNRGDRFRELVNAQ